MERHDSFFFASFILGLARLLLIEIQCINTLSENRSLCLIESIINSDAVGLIKEGFWWEFYAWCIKRNLEIVEIPIKHFNRKYDNTVVFKLKKIPGIAYRNIIGLFKLKNLLKKTS